jgi:formate dehydrogenase subunit beta
LTSYRVPGSPDEALRGVLDHLMREGRVGGVFALTQVMPERYSYALVTDPGLLSKVCPTVPVMPANGGRLAALLTIPEPPDKPIAVVLRPCELRALVELTKLNRARLDDLLLVSLTCSGVLPTRAVRDGFAARKQAYADAAGSGREPEGLRDTCRVCELFVPAGADIVLALAGHERSAECLVVTGTPRGEESLAGVGATPAEDGLDTDSLDEIRKRRAGLKPEVFGRFEAKELGLDGLVDVFGRCINCHACSKACPVCYCTACSFESADAEHETGAFGEELDRRRGIRLPFDTVYYQIGRMVHVGVSCVGCGMCSDACPVDIPVATLFTKLAGSVQAIFDYTAGMGPEEKVPTMTYKADELSGMGK